MPSLPGWPNKLPGRAPMLARVLKALPAPKPELLERLHRARDLAAELVIHDPVYAPHFERAEKEIAALEAATGEGDPVARARAIVMARRNFGSK